MAGETDARHAAGDGTSGLEGREADSPRMDGRLVWALIGSAVVIVLVVLWVGPWLFTRAPDHGLDAEQELKAKNDVRATLVQTVGGLAVAGGLMVTYRTFRQNQRDQTRRWEEQDRTFDQNKLDQERRWANQQEVYQLSLAAQITDTYTKAVEQLGHGQAPVRVGALHSLVRLAQDYPPRRQMVVDVLCAYLRLPYTVPMPDETATGSAALAGAAQELQVRATAQRLLADHLRRHRGASGEGAQSTTASLEDPFWPGINVDLTGATFVGPLDLRDMSAVDADFSGATFPGDATFDGASFSGAAAFDAAKFLGYARFDAANFAGQARFVGTAVSRYARFHGATFSGDAWFTGATLSRYAGFYGAKFAGYAGFHETVFSGRASFAGAEFFRDAEFGGATFSDYARFDGATFMGDARFTATTFSSGARFDEATISSGARFDATVFPSDARLNGVRVLRLDDGPLNRAGDDGRRVWPTGWTVRPDPDDPRRGALVRQTRQELDPALPLPGPPASAR